MFFLRLVGFRKSAFLGQIGGFWKLMTLWPITLSRPFLDSTRRARHFKQSEGIPKFDFDPKKHYFVGEK